MNASHTRTVWWVLVFIFTFVAITNIAGFLFLFGRTKFIDESKESLRVIDSTVRTFFSKPIAGVSPGNSLKEVREQADALRRLFKTPLEGEARRRLAMLEYEFKLGDPLQTLRPLANARDSLSGEALKRHANAWMKLYGKMPPKPQEVPILMKEIRGPSLGWWAKLAEAHAYERAGDKQRSEQLQKQIRSEAMNFTLSLLSILCTLAIALLIGLIVWIVIALFKGWRQLPSRPLPNHSHEALDGSLWGVNLFFITIFCLGLTGLKSDRPLVMELTYLAIAAFVLTSLRSWSNKTGISLGLLGLQLQKPLRNILSGLLAFCAYLVPLIPLLILTHFLSSALPEQTNPIADKAISSLSIQEKISLFLQAAVFAPFIEEIVFRGILFSVLWQRTGRIWLSALASGYLFAVIHPQFLGGLLAITLLGTMMALLYAYTRSLLSCMIVHALNNGAITLLVFLTGSDGEF
jgi:membrane protease YdiL (CAAX protease family)